MKDTGNFNEDVFENILRTYFKVRATKNISDIEKDRPTFLLVTKHENLFKKLGRSRELEGVMILYNPDEINYEIFKSLYAIVIDEDLKSGFPFQDLLMKKYVKAEIDPNLLINILSNLYKHSTN